MTPSKVYTNALQRDEIRALEELKKANVLFGDRPTGDFAKTMKQRRVDRVHAVLRECKALDNPHPSYSRGMLVRLPLVYRNGTSFLNLRKP